MSSRSRSTAASACYATPLSPRADPGGKHEGHPAVSDRNATTSLTSIACRNPPLFQSHDAEAGGEALFGDGAGAPGGGPRVRILLPPAASLVRTVWLTGCRSRNCR